MVPAITVVDALYYSQVLDGILIPILIAITLIISNNKAIMGEYTANRFTNFFAIFAMIITTILTLVMFYQLYTTSHPI
jgi:Mn2+/Fe2+ NRAMP family transporter